MMKMAKSAESFMEGDEEDGDGDNFNIIDVSYRYKFIKKIFKGK